MPETTFVGASEEAILGELDKAFNRAELGRTLGAENTTLKNRVTDKLPIQLLGPEGTTSVEIFEKFLNRQDSKMTVMYRGSDLSMMSRGGAGEKPIGASLQGDETERMETACCRMIQSTANHFLDRQVIRYCFGEGVEPLAYFGLPDINRDDHGADQGERGFPRGSRGPGEGRGRGGPSGDRTGGRRR